LDKITVLTETVALHGLGLLFNIFIILLYHYRYVATKFWKWFNRQNTFQPFTEYDQKQKKGNNHKYDASFSSL